MPFLNLYLELMVSLQLTSKFRVRNMRTETGAFLHYLEDEIQSVNINMLYIYEVKAKHCVWNVEL